MQGRRIISVATSAAIAIALPSILLAQSLRGSMSAVEQAYERASDRGLYFYRTSSGVKTAAANGRFVRLTGNANYETYRVSHPYTTANTRTFVERLAAQYRSGCGEKLVVTSAVRPLTRQPPNSSTLSVHPTGTAVDFRKPRGKCLGWLRKTLLDLEARGIIDATEEFSPPHFHVAIFTAAYERYLVSMGVKRNAGAQAAPASGRPTGSRVALATIARASTVAKSPSRATAGGTTRRYTVRAGDSLWEIARRFDTSVAALRRMNPGKSATILPGQRILVP
jgi:hypothetical protein